MPKINRYRLTNIYYGSRSEPNYIPDLVVEAENQHMLFNLTNTGGKGINILQLFQTVLPNEPMSKTTNKEFIERENSIRRMTKLREFTGHALVEWSLDIPDSYLLVGFCFTRGEKEREVKYFTYRYLYSNLDDRLSIKNIPIIEDNKIKSFSAWRQETKRLKEEIPQFKYYGEYNKKAFQSDLVTFKIFPREWEAMKRTNQSEGGMPAFFQQSSTTSELISKTLFPAVMDVQYEDVDDGKRIAEAFDKFRDQLLTLPVLEKNLDSYNVLRNYTQSVLSAVDEQEHADLEYKIALETLKRTYNSINNESALLDQDLQKLKTELTSIGDRKETLNWQKDSLKHWETILKLKVAEEELGLQLKRCEQLKKRVDAAQSNYNRANAFQLKAKLDDKDGSIESKKQEIQYINQTNEEMLEEYNQVGSTLVYVLNKEIELNQKQIKGLEVKIRENEGEIRSLREKAKLLDASKTEQIRLQIEADQKITAYKGERNKLTTLFDNRWLDDPEQGLQFLEREYKEKDTVLNNKKSELTADEERLTKLSANLTELRVILTSCQGQLTGQQSLLRNILGQQSELKERLLFYGIKGSLPEDVDAVLAALNRKKSEVELRYRAISGEIASLEITQQLQYSAQYYVPNHELLKLSEILKKKNIWNILGSEWLQETTPDPVARQEVLKNNSIIGYSIIIDKSEEERLKTLSLSEIITVPVPIFIKQQVYSMSGLKFSLVDHKGMTLFTDAKALEHYVANISNRLSQKVDEQQKCQTDLEYFVNLINKVDAFARSYPAEKIAEVQNNISNIEQEISFLEKEVDNLAIEEKQLRKEVIPGIKGEIDDLKSNLGKIQSNQDKLQKYIVIFREVPRFKEQSLAAGKAIAGIDQELGLLALGIEQHGNKYLLYQDESRGYKHAIGILKNNISSIAVDNSKEYQLLDKGKEYLWDRYRSLTAKKSGLIVSIDKLNEEIKKLKLDTGDIINRIQKFGYTLSQLEGEYNGELVTDLQIEELYRILTDLDNLYKQEKQTEADLNNNCTSLKVTASTLEGVIKDKHNNREPATFNSDDTGAIAKNLEIQEYELLSQEQEVKSTLATQGNMLKFLNDERNLLHHELSKISDINVDQINIELTKEEWENLKNNIKGIAEELTKSLSDKNKAFQKAVEHTKRCHQNIANNLSVDSQINLAAIITINWYAPSNNSSIFSN